ncbi:hypothetical protein [Streptomyces sp. NPDC057287]|uniref:hypothetical protein n=1 Tax=Streptomyces sp. NPDC057287 TaxID=3346086 RepID=UPI00363E9948
MSQDPDRRGHAGTPPWAGAADGGAPWAATTPSRPAGRSMQRRHRIVEDLPAWEPLPPGDFLLRRPGAGDGS